MNRLVGNLFDMARWQSGKVQLKKEWYDIMEIIGIALSDIHRSLNNRSVKIDIEPELPLIQIDMGLIEQVLVNLVDNAIKYSQHETGIVIRAFRQQEELLVSVQDHGEGIPKTELNAIFDQFYRGKTSQAVKGTGLGLTICKAIIDAHGGRILAESENGLGTSITFTLPISTQFPKDIPVDNREVGNE
jgi:two-component system sensor histidine kinase KdpD